MKLRSPRLSWKESERPYTVPKWLENWILCPVEDGTVGFHLIIIFFKAFNVEFDSLIVGKFFRRKMTVKIESQADYTQMLSSPELAGMFHSFSELPNYACYF